MADKRTGKCPLYTKSQDLQAGRALAGVQYHQGGGVHLQVSEVRSTDTPCLSSKGRKGRITHLPDHFGLPTGQYHTLHAQKKRHQT